MVTVRDLLKTKGDQVWSVSPNTSVLDTLQLLAEKDVGALLVLEDGKIVGIISERDFVRSIAKTGLCVLNTTVLEYMTKKVITVGPDQSIEDCMQVMTKEHIRQIVDLMLAKVANQLKEKGVKLQVTEAAKDLLGEKGFDTTFGARPLRRAIQNMVEDQLSEMLLRCEFSTGDTVELDRGEGDRIVAHTITLAKQPSAS